MATMEEKLDFANTYGEKIVATLHVPDKPLNAGVVMGHCFTCSRHTRILIDLSTRLADNGLFALRFDFSGNGQSGGDFSRSTYTKHIDEMRLAVDLVMKKGPAWIGLAGHSMGAAIAMLAGADSPAVKAVCTLAGRFTQLNPYNLLSNIQKKELDSDGRLSIESRGRSLVLEKTFFDDAGKYSLAQNAAACKKPVLALHGDNDEIIPYSEALEGHRMNPEYIQARILPGVDHMFLDPNHRNQVAGIAADWFHEQFDKSGPTS